MVHAGKVESVHILNYLLGSFYFYLFVIFIFLKEGIEWNWNNELGNAVLM